MSITTQQLAVLRFIRHFIRHFIEDQEYSPSSRIIRDHFGWSSQTSAMNHLIALEAKGLIRRPTHYAIVVTWDGKQLISKFPQ